MKHYGVKVDDGKRKLEVYFRALSYIDWATCYDPEEMLDPSTVRYIVSEYVLRVVTNGEDISPLELLSAPVAVQQSVITAIFNKAIFQDDEKYAKIMLTLEQRSRTLIGCYDLFLYLHLGVEVYLQLLDQDAYTRSQVVMMLEKRTGVNVRERFDFATKNNVALDLISDPDTYKRNLRKHGGPVPANPMTRQNPLYQHQKTMQQMQKPQGPDMPSNIDTMLTDSRSALQAALNAGRKKAGLPQKQKFNWQTDERQFGQVDSE